MPDLLCQLTCRCKDQGLALLQGHVELLQNSDGKCCRFAGAGLRLSDHIMTLEAGYDCTLLDCRRLYKTVGVDSTQQVLLQIHVIEVVHDLIPAALQKNSRHDNTKELVPDLSEKSYTTTGLVTTTAAHHSASPHLFSTTD